MNIKLLIIMIILLIPLSFANVYDYPTLEIMNPYSAYFSAYFLPSESVIALDEDVSFRYHIYLDDDLEHGLFDTDYNTYNSYYEFGVPEKVITSKLRPQTSYGLLKTTDIVRTSINDLPYYISSCHIKCDSDNVLYDYSYYPINLDYADSMELVYDCNYPSEKIANNETIYMTAYCEFGLDKDYASKGGVIDMSELFTNTAYPKNGLSEYGYTCNENPIQLGSIPLEFYDYGGTCRGYLFQVFQLVLVHTDDEYFNYDGNYSSITITQPTQTNISDTQLNNTGNEETGSAGSKTPDKTKEDENNKQKEKQREYEQQLRLVLKKNSFLNSLIDVCVLLFSVMLLSYYLISIAVLGYLLSILFPRIISIPYTIIQEFRTNKGGKQ